MSSRIAIGVVAAVLTGGLLLTAPVSGASSPLPSAHPAAGWRAVSLGEYHACGIQLDRTLWCWGANDKGQLGIRSEVEQHTPTQVGHASDWTRVAAGYDHTCGIRADGSLWCWGDNLHGAVGIRGVRYWYSPQQVDPRSTWRDVAAGDGHTCGVRNTGALRCWGLNNYGQVGDGATHDRFTPRQVGRATANWSSLGLGSQFGCAVRQLGSLYCWGRNGIGELGSGDTTEHHTPHRVGVLESWSSVTAGSAHACATQQDHSAWCWGSGVAGDLGYGDDEPQYSPVQVVDDGTDVSVVAGEIHSCSVRLNSAMWCWGANWKGQLGAGGFGPGSYLPIKVVSHSHWVVAAGNGGSTCGLDTDRRLWCWGQNDYGELGDGTTENRALPTEITPPPRALL